MADNIKRATRADQRAHHYVYKTTCTTTNRWYIGLHSSDILEDGYLGSGSVLSRSVKKYGKENHYREILALFETRQEAAKHEEELITPEVLADPMCMNLGQGGLGSFIRPDHTEVARAKMSDAAKQYWVTLKEDPIAYQDQLNRMITPESIAKRAASNTGKTRTDQTRQKMSESQKALDVSTEEHARRASLGHARRKDQGLPSVGGRKKGTPMTEDQKEQLREHGRAQAVLRDVFKANFIGPIQPKEFKDKKVNNNAEVSCLGCRKIVTPSALTRFHSACH